MTKAQVYKNLVLYSDRETPVRNRILWADLGNGFWGRLKPIVHPFSGRIC